MHELQPRILVFGVGGAGGNAVDNMIDASLRGVEFIAANTDAQALGRSKAPITVQLGLQTTQGLGAGARPERGAMSAEESEPEIARLLDGAHMVFIAAGMGGGTGTGAAPVIARMARERGILTVGVVTKPFAFEGPRRMAAAERGIEELRPCVDTLIIVPNQNLFLVTNEKTPISAAFQMADEVLHAGVRGITDLMVMPGLINLDFADVRTIMQNGGAAMMGTGEASGENRALEAARAAISNPLLGDVSMSGARSVLINITGGYDITLYEVDEATNEIRKEIDPNAEIILGSTFDTELDGKIRVSVVATGLASADGQSLPLPDVMPERPVRSQMSGVSIVRPTVIDHVADEHGDDEDHEDHDVYAPGPAMADPRPDFMGRTLPPAHIPGRNDSERVSTDMVFGGRSGASAPATSNSPTGQGGGNDRPLAGFSKLFGWRNAEDGRPADGIPPVRSRDPVVSKTDEQPEPAPFDDDDLEIPAFLRRSASH